MRVLSVVLLTAWTAVVLQPAVSSWNFHRHETARIRAHLERVEVVLRARDVTSLAPEQQRARARCLDVLRAYHQAGEFPHNHDFASREPYFVDRHGARCAMAELIERAGGAALVQRVATDANNARVRELSGDAELVAWLGENGMTAEEAALVQPAYDDPPPFNDYVARSERNSHAALHATAIGVGVAGVGINGLHRISPDARRASMILGVLAAGTSLAIGGTLIDKDPALSMVDMGIGLASLIAAVHNYNHLEREPRVRMALRASPGLRVSREGVPQLAVRVGF